MAVSLTQLLNETYGLLAEATDSPLGEVVDGASIVARSGQDALTDLLHQGARELARTCLPIRAATGAESIAIGAREVVLKAYSAVYQPTLATTFTLFAATAVIGASPLTEVSEQVVQAYDLDYQTTTGTPEVWYPTGDGKVGLYPVPSALFSGTFHGLATPPAPSGADATPYWQDDISLFLLPRYAATLLAQMGIDDDRLAQKALLWQGEYEERRRELRMGVAPGLASRLMPLPPVPVKPPRKAA